MAGSDKTPVSTTPYALVAVGIALTTTSTLLNGVVRGLCLGAGIAMILVSVALFSAEHRRGKEDPDNGGLWLPSRDEDPK
ncbi:hypothetical protein [Nocardioides alcanivorans]|uniref:hypothetical protein n=1 Tax=Nocardioides alcanivorans TaxID=2897352 RepID=UPI001F32C59D|nr:hypothetical protein [Nocardioides alcanivorans]